MSELSAPPLASGVDPAPLSAPQGGHPVDVGHDSTVSSSAVVGSPAEPSSTAGPSVSISSDPTGGFPDDLDLNNVPPELRKEGSDWSVIFNPKVKKVLDVGLVHSLVHKRCVTRSQ
jgi:glucose repression regulatory protein TUP1